MDTLKEYRTWRKEHYGKLTYLLPTEARQAILEMAERGCTKDPDLLHPYLCTFCSNWHIGHYPGSQGKHSRQELSSERVYSK